MCLIKLSSSLKKVSLLRQTQLLLYYTNYDSSCGHVETGGIHALLRLYTEQAGRPLLNFSSASRLPLPDDDLDSRIRCFK